MSTQTKVAMIVDGVNTSYAVRPFYALDWRKISAIYANQFRCIARYYATGTRPIDDQFNPIAKLLDWLEYNGYRVVRKVGREFTNEGETVLRDADVRVDITLIAVGLIGRVDEIHLWSSDGSYVPLVEALQRAGIRVVIFSTMDVVSDKLRRAADEFVDLSTKKNEFGRPDIEPAGDA